MKKLLSSAFVSFAVVIVPALGNADILRAAHLWVVWALGILASVLQPAYNPFTIAGRSGDKGTGAQIIWSVYAVQLAAVAEAAYWRYPGSVTWDPVAIVSLAAAVAGLAIRTWAVITLKRFFTMHISVEENHKLIRSGPYAWVRHPSYLGAFLLFVSMAGFLHAWVSVVIGIILLPLAFLRRIHCEEALLKRQFGVEYETYSRDVRMILPGIW